MAHNVDDKYAKGEKPSDKVWIEVWKTQVDKFIKEGPNKGYDKYGSELIKTPETGSDLYIDKPGEGAKQSTDSMDSTIDDGKSRRAGGKFWGKAFLGETKPTKTDDKSP